MTHEPGTQPARATNLRDLAGYAPLVLAGIAVALAGSAVLAAAWCVASRLAYVIYVGLSLRAESKLSAAVGHAESEARWQTFRTRASRIMVGDAVALSALCIVTRGTLALPGAPWATLVAGLVLVAVGIVIKTWATASLPEGTFYWRDFFVPAEHREFSATGPYRWLSNPMYTVGYAHAYGFALLLRSWPGLAGALFAQVAVLLLAALVERPHTKRFAQR